MTVNRAEVKHWLEDDDYNKARFQLQGQITGVMDVFRMYGMQEYVPGAIEEIIRLAEDFSLRTRGVDKPISLERIRRKKERR